MGLGLPPLELLERLGLGIALAIFLGLAFEETYKREQRDVPGGVRTFPMLALSGALLYLIEPRYAIAFIVGLLSLSMWLFAHLRGAPPESTRASLMIPASNVLAYLIGPLTLLEAPWLAVAVSVAAVLLLSGREPMHRFVAAVPRDEILTAGKFLILTGVILPFVPDTPVFDFTPLTPYRVWLAVVAICGLSYASYLILRYAPGRGGPLWPAALGGLYSSTATTVVFAKRQREAGAARADVSAAIVAATAVMYLRIGVLVALFDLRFAAVLVPAVIVLFAAGAAMTAFEWRRFTGKGRGKDLAVPPKNPLELPTAFLFAALFAVIYIASGWAGAAFGETGVFALAVVAGATDIDPFVLTMAQGGVPQVPLGVVSAAVLIAASANNLVKAGYALVFGGVAGASRPAALLTALALIGFAAAAVYML